MEREHYVWIDYLRMIACFMVMVVHSTEPFYLGGEGAQILTRSDAVWAAFFDSLVRACVPMFIIASSFVQFPIHYSTSEFFRKRAVRILVPFAIWSVFYALYWGEPVENLKDLLLNFNYAAGHLWFVYMIIGLYLIMPVLSPWAEKVGIKELSAYILLWLATTIIPLARDWVNTEPVALIYGPSGIPRQALFPLWGEASWNQNGTFYYVSGVVGYLLLGLWLRKFGDRLRHPFAIALPSFIAGFAICFCGFLRRVLAQGCFPAGGDLTYAVWWETTWCFDTIGVALMTIGNVLMIREIKASGRFYKHIVKPIAEASYGMYLCHMVALSSYATLFRGLIPSTPLVILATAAASYLTVSVFAIVVRKIPVVGKYIMG